MFFSLSEERWPPRHRSLSFLQSDFLSPISVLLFFTAAVTESPVLFPVMSACCLATAEAAFAGGLGDRFDWVQLWATAPRGTQHFTISQLLVRLAKAPRAQGRLHKGRMEAVWLQGSVVTTDRFAAVAHTHRGSLLIWGRLRQQDPVLKIRVLWTVRHILSKDKRMPFMTERGSMGGQTIIQWEERGQELRQHL